MIIFDIASGLFRDTETGRIRSDVSGLASSNARRQLLKNKRRKPTLEFLKTYRKRINVQKLQKSKQSKTQRKKRKKKLKKKRAVFEETNHANYKEYIDGWLEDYDFIIEEEDTDLETP